MVQNDQEMSENSANPVEVKVITSNNNVSEEDEEEEEKHKQQHKNNNENACVVIDVKELEERGENNWDGGGEKVCRICHLNDRDCPSTKKEMENLDLIQLGCSCKDELGIAHRHCGEAWFKLKGNRCCEICGEAAKNITGVGDSRFMEEWNETSDGNSGNSELRRGFFRGQPFCNFLMACLVIAFILPWFFRVSMF